MKFRHPLLVSGIVLALAGCAQTPADHTSTAAEQAPNIIYFIGDGMGFEYISAYRYAMSELGSDTLVATPFDDMLVGAATTYPDDDTWVTDSAAGATALATGHKSYNGAIGVDAEQHPQQTLMEKARELGWHTGAVATSQVNHATPASFFTHHPSRQMYNEIADSYATTKFGDKWSFDVLLGGGTRYFTRDDKNWLPELRSQGMNVVTDMAELGAAQAPVLGLFAPVGLPFALDDKPYLAELTTQALRVLTTEQAASGKPFALMVEGSKIDWCGHANDIACVIHEMHDFAQALQVARDFQANNPNTIIVVTADHSTGGLTLGQGGEYAWHTDRVMGIKATFETLVQGLLERPQDQWRDYLTPLLNLPMTDAHWQQLTALELSGDNRKADGRAVQQALIQLTSELTRTGWTTSGHTAVDVPVMASGPYAERLRGYKNNTDIAKLLLEIVR